MSFSSDIAKFVAKTNRRNNAIVRKLVIDMGTSLVMKTPVGNPELWEGFSEARSSANNYHWLEKAGFFMEGYVGGAARANWQYGNLIMPESVVDAVDTNGTSTINKIIGGVKASPAASIHWISNNLPYIQRLEEGYSKKQAPQGMLRLTVTEFEQTVRDAIKNVN